MAIRDIGHRQRDIEPAERGRDAGQGVAEQDAYGEGRGGRQPARHRDPQIERARLDPEGIGPRALQLALHRARLERAA